MAQIAAKKIDIQLIKMGPSIQRDRIFLGAIDLHSDVDRASPIGDDDSCSSDLGRQSDRKRVPIVPSDGETEGRIHKSCSKVSPRSS
jgi:hypothetical protein